MSKEIVRKITVPETPEPKCGADCFNRTVVEAVRCILIDSKLPKKLLGLSCRYSKL